MKVAILTIALGAAGTLAGAFLGALLTSLHPEQHGLANRMVIFGWRYGLASGVTAAAPLFIPYSRVEISPRP